ncbi:MAG: CapA family protein [Veillonella sp.]|uniref:CapA family protein n=1 Tax=Veillonella sp. TaxID=1926307 RepID=UPI0025DF2A28|nr:CapA family protein [Veillonella sp.]MBS5336464.1 CapA family protein [Veillonella sp.]
MRIYIGADLVPTDINKSLFENGNGEALVGKELYEILKQSDLNVFNLEVPLTDVETPIVKFGNNLIAPTKTIHGYKALEPIFLTLANNHSLDQGEEGLTTTLNLLKDQDIAHAGAGSSLKEAKKPFIFEKEGIRIGFYLCAEHEFTVASCHTMGANPFDVLESFDEVLALKEQCDYVIVLYHGGKEFYRYPSPMLQRYCRKFIDRGANLVMCQHNHCVGSREDYNGGSIIYGQGNFIFNSEFYINHKEFVKDSLLIRVEATKDSFIVSEVPIRSTEMGTRQATESEADETLTAYKQRSENIKDAHFVAQAYKDFADTHIKRYLREFIGRSCIIRAINALFSRKLMQLILGKTSYLAIQNYLECEAHHELFLRGIKNINKK